MSTIAPEGRSSPPQAGRILVVDDEPEFINILRKSLGRMGYEVLGAGSADEALELFEPHGFDLAFVDIRMPGLSGLELVSAIKQIAPGVPVVVATAYSTVEHAVKAFRAGASDFLSKPLQLPEVGTIVERLILNRVSHTKVDHLMETLSEEAEGADKLVTMTQDGLTDLTALRETYRSNADSNTLYAYLASAAYEVCPMGHVVVSVLDTSLGIWTIREVRGFSKSDPTIPSIIDLVNADEKTDIPSQYRAMIDSQVKSLVKLNRPLSTRDVTSIPLRIKGQVFGALHVFHVHRPRAMSAVEMGPFVVLADEASLCLENALLYEKIYENLVNGFRNLVDLVEYKDPYIKDHSKGVGVLASAIALEMGCSREEGDALKFACYFHDVGKVAIRDSIIQKEGTLTNEEYETIKTHTVIGEKLLEPLGLFPMEKTVIRHHHERIDGSGYPDGFTDRDLTLYARITAVADVFDAMVSARSYRPAYSHEAVMAHLRADAGKKFDAQVVEALGSVAQKHPHDDLRQALAS